MEKATQFLRTYVLKLNCLTILECDKSMHIAREELRNPGYAKLVFMPLPPVKVPIIM